MIYGHFLSGRPGWFSAAVLALVMLSTGLFAGIVPTAPDWPQEYEAVTGDFRALVTAAHRLDLAQGRLERARHQGGTCEPCEMEIATARQDRDRLGRTLAERLERYLARQGEVIADLDGLAQNLHAADPPRSLDLEPFFRTTSDYRDLLARHHALGTSFGELADLVGSLSRQPQPRAQTAEPIERMVRVLRTVAEKSFQQVTWCLEWAEAIGRGSVHSGKLESLYASIDGGILVSNLGKSADLLASAPAALREQIEHFRDDGAGLQTSYEGSRGRVYRAVVEVVPQDGEPLEDTQERAKVLATRQLQQMVDHTIARLDPQGLKRWKVTFFQGLMQRVELLDDGRVRASAEVLEDDVFPLIPLPDLTSLGI